MADKKSELDLVREYQNEPGYTGYEDDTPEGRKALKAYNKAARADDNEVPSRGRKVSKAGVKAARGVIGEHQEKMKPSENTNPMGDTYRKGGKVKSASARADGCACRGKTRA